MNELSIFDSLFNDVLGGNVEPVMVHTPYVHSPKVDVYETEDAYTLEMQLPGRCEKDINIELNHNTLTISSKVEEAEKNCTPDKEEKERKYLVRECHTPNFSRSFTLPQDIDDEKISASFKNGILKVDMKKKEEATPKKITIACKD